MQKESRTAAVAGTAAQLPPASSIADRGYLAVAGLAASARDDRAKINIFLPPFNSVAYIYPRYRDTGIPGNFRRATEQTLPRHPRGNCDYYYGGFEGDIYAADIDQPDAFRRKDDVPANGKLRSVGVLPDAKISLLAFGSVPVTATLHIRQIVANGRIEPLYIDQIGDKHSYPRGYKIDPDDIFRESQCDPAWDSQPAEGVTFAVGRVTLAISNVAVDGHQVPVGSSCRASSPLQIHLDGGNVDHGGTFSDFLGPRQILYQRRTPGFTPDAAQTQVYPGSTNLDIPSFTGCRSPSGDDVSRVITALASGPSNTLAVEKDRVAVGLFDPEHPTLCGVLGNNGSEPDTASGQYCVIKPAPVPTPPGPGK